jgi:predicted PurR-regulated permease PerM
VSGRRITVALSRRTILVAVAVVGLGWAFVTVRGVLMVIFLALFATLVLDPPVQAVERRLHLGRGAAVAAVMLSLLAVVTVGMALIVVPLADAVRDFVDALPGIVRDIRESSVGRWIDEHSDAGELTQGRVQELASGVAAAAGGALGVATSTFGLVFGSVTALFMTIFLLLDLPRLQETIDSLLTPAQSKRWRRLNDEITHTLSRTMLAAVALAVICGTTYGLAGWALGAPYPLALGVIAGFLDLIPTVGATIAGVIIVLATLTAGFGPALVMLVLVVVYQQVENHVLQPTVVGRAARVSGFFVLASVLVFGALFGIVGAVIAVPLAASIQIGLRELSASRREAMAVLRRTELPERP